MQNSSGLRTIFYILIRQLKKQCLKHIIIIRRRKLQSLYIFLNIQIKTILQPSGDIPLNLILIKKYHLDNTYRLLNTSVAGPDVPTIVRPGTCMVTGSCWPSTAFFAPTLARCTINFLSPNCIPFSPAIAWK